MMIDIVVKIKYKKKSDFTLKFIIKHIEEGYETNSYSEKYRYEFRKTIKITFLQW